MELLKNLHVLPEPKPETPGTVSGGDLMLDLKSVPLSPSSKAPTKDPHGFCVEWQIEPAVRDR